jgi:4-amino-4-deoxy-L-arabinose transferase-like glycosyltransferase
MRARDYVLLVLLCVALFVPGLARMPPLDRDEPRFAQASRQMVESGDFIDIRFQAEPRLKKPVGIYWLQAASAAVFSAADSDRIWPYRLPSTVGATLAVLLTAALGARLFGREAGLVAALLLASCAVLSAEARIAKTDAALLASVVAAQLALGKAYLERDRQETPGYANPILFWAALGAGILIKGPIILMVSGLTALGLVLWDRSARWLQRLKPWPLVLLTILVVAPWVIGIMLRTKGAFLSESVEHDLLGKVAGAQEAHGAPPGFFLVTFWGTFWPGSLLAALAIPWVWRHRRDDAVRFCLAWLVPSWLVFEAVPTKLVHYTLPLVPAIALLAARAALEPFPRFNSRAGRIFVGVAVGGWLLITAAMAAGLPLAPAIVEHRIDVAALAVGVAALLAFLAALYFFRAGRRPAALRCLVVGCVAFYATVYDRVIPELDALWISTRVANAVRAAERCPKTVVTSVGFAEPSLVFILGTDTAFGNSRAAARAIADNRCAMALVDAPSIEAFRAELAETGKEAREVATIDGINMARGKPVTLTLFEVVGES